MKVEDGGQVWEVRSVVLRRILRYFRDHERRLHLDEAHSGEVRITYGPRGTTAQHSPAMPTRPNEPETTERT
jgi:hypothetical protein